MTNVETVESSVTNPGSAEYTWGNSIRCNAAGRVYHDSRRLIQPRQQHPSSPPPNAPIPGPSLNYRHTHPMASPHAPSLVPPNIGRKDGDGHGISRFTGNNQVQPFPRGNTAPARDMSRRLGSQALATPHSSGSITNQGFALPVKTVESGCTSGDSLRWDPQVWPEYYKCSTGHAAGSVPMYEQHSIQPRQRRPPFSTAPNGHIPGLSFNDRHTHGYHMASPHNIGRRDGGDHRTSAPNGPIPDLSLNHRHTHGYHRANPHASHPPNIGRKDGGDHRTSAPNAPIPGLSLNNRHTHGYRDHPTSTHAPVPPNIGRKDCGDHRASMPNGPIRPGYDSQYTRGYLRATPHVPVPPNIGRKDGGDHRTSTPNAPIRPGLDSQHTHGYPMAMPHAHAPVPLHIGRNDNGGHKISRFTRNDQVQAFPRRDTAPVQIHHQSISIDRAPSVPNAPTRNEGDDKAPLTAKRKPEQEKAGHEHQALPSSKQNTSANGNPILCPDRREGLRTESANALPARTNQSHGASASTSTAQLPSTPETPTPQRDNNRLLKPDPKKLRFKKNKRPDMPPEQPKLVVKEEEKNYINIAQPQENGPETELFVFQDPLVPPSIVVLLPGTDETETASGVTMAPTQPAHPTLATTTPTAAKSADQPEKPSRKRKKNQANIGEVAEEGGKPVKKPRKKKGEAVESRTQPGSIEGGESGRGATLAVGSLRGNEVEKQPRKKKEKADGEVVSVLESEMVQLNVQDAASRNADVERASTAGAAHAQISESDQNVGTEVAMAVERGKVEEKKTSGRGRKRKKPGDEGASGPSQKKKKVKLEDEEMGGDEGGNDEMDDPISGNNAITGEWARKRTRSSKSNVKWTVFSGDGNFITAATKPTKASKSKRVANSSSTSVETTFTPERILRPNIWAASKSELVFVLPELSQSRSYNGVTESSSNFPMVLLDESTADSIGVQVEKLGGDGPYGMVRLTLVRDFVCPPEELVGSDCNFSSGSAVPSASVSVHPPQQEEDPEDSGLEYIDEPIPAIESIPMQASIPERENELGAMSLVSDHISASPAHQQQPTISFVPPSHAPGPSILTIPSSAMSDHISASPAHQQQPTISFVPPNHAPGHNPSSPIFTSNPIPRTLSPEIDILTSTSSLSLPIILISSKEVFNRAFSIATTGIRPKIGLGEEHAYVFWGFFKFREDENQSQKRMRVVNVQWDVVQGEGGSCNQVVRGRVEWVFDLEWVPGWDGSDNGNAMRPWWADVLDPLDERFGAAAAVDYSDREKAKWMNLNLLPAQIADGQEEGSADDAMPRGWLCKKCGRLNRKVMMRHRWCGGVALGCRDNPISKGYAVELWDTRDPRQTALAFPINVCDEKRVDVRVADWDDGMRTLKYRPMTIALMRINALEEPRFEEVDGKGILKHVFTCNSEELQREATPLFSRIQRDVCLSKKIGDSGPYFKCDVSDSYASKRDKYAFSCMTWENAPQVVRDVQDLMVHMGRSYGEDQNFMVDWLTILGWISSGNRKTSEKLSSKDRTVAMMCLGNDVILTITPKWEIEESPPALNIMRWEESDAQSAPTGTLGTSFYPVVSGNVEAGVAAETQTGTRTHNQERPISAQAGVPAGKKSRVESDPSAETMSVTVVHGDMLLFSGCDFEYSIKRLGTSILVVGGVLYK